ncbi:MAG TPA: hypothetical protein DDW27_21250 [Bacteroidales bacterium]|nr:hypothetical protein [Bacteroidales bacterium]
MDIYYKKSHSLAILVTENNKKRFSSYSLTDCSVIKYGYDNILKTKYPESLRIRSFDDNFPFQADFEFEKILDRKDLLDGVNPLLKFLIKKLIAKPVYHGILSRVRLEIKNQLLDGYGNFESMVFRGK